MKAFVPTVLVLVSLLGAVSIAQDRDPPGIPVHRGKNDGLKMVPPDSGAKDDAGKPVKEPEEAAAPKSPFEILLGRLATWPSQDAHEAAAALSIRGPEIEPQLLAVLPDAAPDLAAGIAFVLGDVGGDASLAAVQRLAAVPSMAEHLPLIFDVLGRLDGVNAVKRILPFLRHPKRRARDAAEYWLRDRINASFADRLEAMLDEPFRGARLSSLRLLDRVSHERACLHAFELLGDEAPEVARSSAEILASRPDPEIVRELNELVCGFEDRKVAYATLALVTIEEQTGERAFQAETIPHLLGPRGLKSPEKINRGAAAIALADIGFDSEIPEVDAVLDREVVLTLLDTVGGKKFFPDFGSVAELARNRFGKLTGVLERRAIPELWEWWASHKEGFVARRALREIPADRLGAFRIRARSLVEPALPTILLSTVAEDAGGPEVLGIDFVYLLPDAARHLASVLSSELFLMPDGGVVNAAELLGGGATGPLGPDVVVTISLENRSRSAVSRGDRVPEPLRKIIRELKRVREQYAWQRFWDRDTYSRYEEFIRVESEFFGSNPPVAERDERLKNLVLSSLDDLTTDIERTEAVGLLQKLSASLTDSEAYRLALLVEEEAELNPFVERLVGVLAAAKKPLVLPVLAGWFERHPGPKSLDLFVQVLGGLSSKHINRASIAERVFLRRAAVRAAPMVLDGEALRGLMSVCFRDESSTVRREVLITAGRSRFEGALSVLVTGLDDPDPEVQLAAIEGMGLLARAEVIPVLARELRSDSLARKVAAVRALCETRLKEAIPPVLGVLTGEESGLVRSVASRQIVSFGLPALNGLSEIVMATDTSASVRAQALEPLARIGGDHVLDVLGALLADPEDEVADGAAYALAARGDSTAVPRLLDALEKGRNPVFTVAALEQISGQAFPTARPDELPVVYRGWWNENQGGSEWDWFVGSLGQRAYEVADFPPLREGRPGKEVVPVLIRALMDRDWFIRANANLWLQRATLENFGEVNRFTLEDDVRAVHAAWRTWWESR